MVIEALRSSDSKENETLLLENEEYDFPECQK